MGLTDYAEDRILQHCFMGVPYTAPSTVYLALYTTSPTDVGTDGVEVAGGSYARQPVTFALAAGGAGKISNDTGLTFPGMPACTLVAGALFDDVLGGNMLACGDLPNAVAVSLGDNQVVPIGSFNFFLD